MPRQLNRPSTYTLQRAWHRLRCVDRDGYRAWSSAGLKGTENTEEAVLNLFCGGCTVAYRAEQEVLGRCMRAQLEVEADEEVVA